MRGMDVFQCIREQGCSTVLLPWGPAWDPLLAPPHCLGKPRASGEIILWVCAFGLPHAHGFSLTQHQVAVQGHPISDPLSLT